MRYRYGYTPFTPYTLYTCTRASVSEFTSFVYSPAFFKAFNVPFHRTTIVRWMVHLQICSCIFQHITACWVCVSLFISAFLVSSFLCFVCSPFFLLFRQKRKSINVLLIYVCVRTNESESESENDASFFGIMSPSLSVCVSMLSRIIIFFSAFFHAFFAVVSFGQSTKLRHNSWY